MASIIYKPDSLLDATERHIIHGCNAQGKMGSGVARVLFERYPDVRECYLRAYSSAKALDEPFLGTVHYVFGTPHTVINAITQEYYGYDNARYVSYEAIESCFVTVNSHAQARNADTTGELVPMPAIAMPLIGAGLAGGSWATISSIIERVSTEFQPVVYLNGSDVPTT